MSENFCQVSNMDRKEGGHREGRALSVVLWKGCLAYLPTLLPAPEHISTNPAPWSPAYSFSTRIRKYDVDGGHSRWISGEENSRSPRVWLTCHSAVSPHALMRSFVVTPQSITAFLSPLEKCPARAPQPDLSFPTAVPLELTNTPSWGPCCQHWGWQGCSW